MVDKKGEYSNFLKPEKEKKLKFPKDTIDKIGKKLPI